MIVCGVHGCCGLCVPGACDASRQTYNGVRETDADALDWRHQLCDVVALSCAT